MNCPALASPGGDSGVRTPIFTGFWARAGAVNTHATIATSTAAALVGHVRPLICSLRRSSRSCPLLQQGLVHVHAEARAVEGLDRAVGVLDRPADHVTLQ